MSQEAPRSVQGSAGFHSVLFRTADQEARSRAAIAPSHFGDLHLDQVLSTLTVGRAYYNLEPLFYAPLHDVESVRYRHEVMRDLEDESIASAVREFARAMAEMRELLQRVEKLHNRYQQQCWFLATIGVYVDAVASLREELTRLEPSSTGLLNLRDYLAAYVASPAFVALESGVASISADLADVHYCIHIKGNRVTVRLCEDEPDYSADVEATFARFQQGAVKDYRVKLSKALDMDHVEAQILERVTWLYPETFRRLGQFTSTHQGYLDETIERFDREIQLYLAYLELTRRLRAGGLEFCYPEVQMDSHEIFAEGAFDLALASKLNADSEPVVTNDFELQGPERIIVITGPNQGGKTTFARMVGQIHYLASLGLPVPGRRAALFLPDRIFTHFEREERLTTLRGKLEDELVRIHEILADATRDSLLIMNESFASTTVHDALLLGTAVMEQIIDRGLVCVYVTFLDELASLGPATVSMMSTVVPEDPATRTYKVVRAPANGLAYAGAIAEKYRLSYESLKRRVLG